MPAQSGKARAIAKSGGLRTRNQGNLIDATNINSYLKTRVANSQQLTLVLSNKKNSNSKGARGALTMAGLDEILLKKKRGNNSDVQLKKDTLLQRHILAVLYWSVKPERKVKASKRKARANDAVSERV